MEEQQRTELRNMVSIFIGLMFVKVYEFFLSDIGRPTLSFISYAAGILLILLFNRKHCWSLSDFGIQGVINNTFWEVILPALIWLGSLAIIIIPEYLICTFGGEAEYPYFDLICFNQHVDLILSKSDNTILVTWTIMGALICAFRALFLEVFFRGFAFGVLRKKTGFYVCNAVQALFYTMFFFVGPVRSLMLSEDKGKTVVLFLLFFAAQFLFAFRQGYLRLVCGTIWPCVLTTFLFNFFTYNVVIVGLGGTEFVNYADYIRWILIQGICLLGTLAYCKKMKKKFPPPKPNPAELEEMKALAELEAQQEEI